MNFSKKMLQKAAFSFVVFALIFSNTVNIYAGVGNFTKVSNNLQISNVNSVSTSSFPPMMPAAAAIGVAYAAGFAVGTIAHHAWNSFITMPANNGSIAIAEHRSNDFSKFDN